MTPLLSNEYAMLIDGTSRRGGAGTYAITNPSTEELVGEAPAASVSDVGEACAAARRAQPAWAGAGPAERGRLLLAVAARMREMEADLTELEIAEAGMTRGVSRALQMPSCANRFERYGHRARLDFDVAFPPTLAPATPFDRAGLIGGVAHRRPVGVVGCITSYNSPIGNMAGKAAPALAMGNTIVMKPAPQDPLGVLVFAEICNEVGIPPGVVNVVTGPGADIGQALVDSPDVDSISFTGSTAVGARIQELSARTMKRTVLELGGKGGCIVCADADLDAAADALASVWAFHAGQICIAPTRAIVHRSVYGEMVDRLVAASKAMKIGDPSDADTVVGPLISHGQRQQVRAHIESAMADGAEVLVGGVEAPAERGFFVAPTLLVGCDSSMKAVQEEIFGPVLAVLTYDDEDEAVRIANDSDYGLFDWVFSRDVSRAWRLGLRLEAGSVGINTLHRKQESPFGGMKMSGLNRDGGDYALEAYTELQAITWRA